MLASVRLTGIRRIHSSHSIISTCVFSFRCEVVLLLHWAFPPVSVGSSSKSVTSQMSDRYDKTSDHKTFSETVSQKRKPKVVKSLLEIMHCRRQSKEVIFCGKTGGMWSFSQNRLACFLMHCSDTLDKKGRLSFCFSMQTLLFANYIICFRKQSICGFCILLSEHCKKQETLEQPNSRWQRADGEEI